MSKQALAPAPGIGRASLYDYAIVAKIRLYVWTLICLVFAWSGAGGQGPDTGTASLRITRTELVIHMPEAGEAGLHATLILPVTSGKHPLVLMMHGS